MAFGLPVYSYSLNLISWFETIMPLHTFIEKTKSYCLIHVFQGRIQGEGAGGAHPPWDDLRLSNTTGILQKKNTMWFIGVEVEQETSAPPPKKILDPPLCLAEQRLIITWFAILGGNGVTHQGEGRGAAPSHPNSPPQSPLGKKTPKCIRYWVKI